VRCECGDSDDECGGGGLDKCDDGDVMMCVATVVRGVMTMRVMICVVVMVMGVVAVAMSVP